MKVDFEAAEHVGRYLKDGPPAFAPGHAGLLQMASILITEQAPFNAVS